MNVSHNFHRNERQAKLCNARESIRWARVHEAEGDFDIAKRCLDTARANRIAQRALSKDQKRMDAIWAKL